jgi:hypothetical protein
MWPKYATGHAVISLLQNNVQSESGLQNLLGAAIKG